MPDDFDAFEQELRQFQPRRPMRPLPSLPAPRRTAPVQLVAAAVLLAALTAALGPLTRTASDQRTSTVTLPAGPQSIEDESRVTAGRLTRAALDASRGVEAALASATPNALMLVERDGGPLHALARE